MNLRRNSLGIVAIVAVVLFACNVPKAAGPVAESTSAGSEIPDRSETETNLPDPSAPNGIDVSYSTFYVMEPSEVPECMSRARFV